MKLISMCLISFFSLLISSFILFFYSISLLMDNYVIFIEWEVISINSIFIVMTILLDWMSLMFMSFVLLISSLVIFYSMEYMSNDNNINRFLMLVLMFIMSMMLLIISPNLISILLGWDGLGLVSYCLVIYFQNVKSYNAGMLTALSNRVGDVMILLAISWMLNFGSYNFIFNLEYYDMQYEMKLVGVLIVVAAMTKSAQIPFSSWLPAAMAAPTPVSALVHSSTLVTAGVYLLIRFNILLIDSMIGKMLLLISSLTMFMAGLGANFEFDLKKIIALSTLSQLGLMMSVLCMGFFKLAFFHLLTHALFKALLFLCAGSIIHNMNNIQDIRFMGNLSIYMPITSMCFNVSNLALCGMPFLAGFYSKDLILEMILMMKVSSVIFFFFFFSTGLTVCYSFRLLYYSLVGDLNCGSLNLLSDEGWIMLSGMLGLTFMSLIGGSMLNWLIFFTPHMICLPVIMKQMTLFICLFGGLFGFFMSSINLYKVNKSLKFFNCSVFLSLMWFMPYIMTVGVSIYFLKVGKEKVKVIDQGWLEYYGSSMIYKVLIKLSQLNQEIQYNNLKIYMNVFILWIFIFIFLIMF